MGLQKNTIEIVVNLFLVCFLGGQVLAEEAKPKSIVSELDWSVSSSNAKKLNDLNSETINEFLFAFHKDNPLTMGMKQELGDFVFVDLDKDNQYELVGTLDYTGRAFFNTVTVVRKTDEGFEVQDIRGFNIFDLKSAISDLNNDGIMELIIEDIFGTYRGADPAPMWTDIYRLEGLKYVKSSHEFPGFYKKRLVVLREKLKTLKNPKWKDAYEIEMEKIQRFLNPGSNVGIERAKVYLNSNNFHLQLDALKILGDIGDHESVAILKKLSASSDFRIAGRAKASLEMIEKRKDKSP